MGRESRPRVGAGRGDRGLAALPRGRRAAAVGPAVAVRARRSAPGPPGDGGVPRCSSKRPGGHLAHHYGLSTETAALLRSVLVEGRAHELGSALLAIAGALFFGVGFGRVLQLVHARAWGVSLPSRQTDYALYAFVLLAVYGLILLLLVQLTELKDSPSWIGKLLAVGWVGLLVLFFTWAPWLLTHGRISRRDLLPSAALTAVGLVVLMIVSSYVMEPWVDLYARDYGGLGVVLAIYFWLAFSSAVIVWAAALAPALAQRRAATH